MPKRSYIPKNLITALIEVAGGTCEYCKCFKKYCPDPFVTEHIIPLFLDGENIFGNLARSCGGCNSFKHTFTQAIDPLTGISTPLFHPRKDHWEDHFKWSENYLEIIGKTPIGRATILKLKLNREGLVNLRTITKLTQEHPPVEKK